MVHLYLSNDLLSIYTIIWTLSFSQSGLAKLATNKDVYLPNINPETGRLIDTIGTNSDINSNFQGKGVISINDSNNAIKVIADGASNSTGVFANSPALTTINLPVLERIGTNAFFNPATAKNKISTLDLPALKEIADYAFVNSVINSVNLPSLTTIGANAFLSNVGISTLNLPLVTNIGPGAFSGAKVSVIEAPLLQTVGSSAFNGNALTTLDLPSLTSVADHAFESNQLVSVNLPNVVSIGSQGFLDNNFQSLTDAMFPNLQTIGGKAFFSNPIATVNLSHVTSLGINSFSANLGDLANQKLVSMTLPALTSIGAGAVVNQPGDLSYGGLVVIWTDNTMLLNKENYIINPGSVNDPTAWVESDFVWDSANPSRVLGFTDSGKSRLLANDFSVAFPERATIIADSAFSGSMLKSVSGSNVQIIESHAFENNRLTTIDFPLLERIESYAFKTNYLTTLNLPSVTYIGDYAFDAYDNNQAAYRTITELIAPKLETVGAFVFRKQKITKLELPNVRTIGAQAFTAMELTEVYLPLVEVIKTAAFANYSPEGNGHNNLKTINLPSIVDIDSTAFQNNGLHTAYLPATLTSTNYAVNAFSRNYEHNFDTSQHTQIVTKVFLPNHENPNNLQDYYLNSVLVTSYQSNSR